MLRHKDKECLIPRLLKNLENLIRSLLIHSLGEPDYHRLILRRVALELKFADYLLRLLGRDKALHRFAEVEVGVPFIGREDSSVTLPDVSPLLDKHIADNSLISLLLAFVYGEDHM